MVRWNGSDGKHQSIQCFDEWTSNVDVFVVAEWWDLKYQDWGLGGLGT